MNTKVKLLLSLMEKSKCVQKEANDTTIFYVTATLDETALNKSVGLVCSKAGIEMTGFYPPLKAEDIHRMHTNGIENVRKELKRLFWVSGVRELIVGTVDGTIQFNLGTWYTSDRVNIVMENDVTVANNTILHVYECKLFMSSLIEIKLKYRLF